MGTKRSLYVSDALITKLEGAANYRFIDRELGRAALWHKAVVELSDERTLMNQRLEFLGDAVLSYVVSWFLYEYYPHRDEGFLSRMRSKIVDNRNLARTAEKMGLKDIASSIRISKGKKGGGRYSGKVLGDIFESVIGSIYLDGGIELAEKFIVTILLKDIDEVEKTEVDYKTWLQEWCQKRGVQLPSYIVLYTVGPEHDKTYTISVRVEKLGRAIGVGKSKKDAEQDAAKKLYEVSWGREKEKS